MIPIQRPSSSPQNFNSRAQQQQQQQLHHQQTPPARDTHPAMIISHQPFDANSGYYGGSQQQQQQQQHHGRLANPTSYHSHQLHKQQIHTIDPQLLGVSPQQHHPYSSQPQQTIVKQEDPTVGALGDALNEAYLNIDYDIGAGLEMGDPSAIMHGHPHAGAPQHHPHHPHHPDPASIMSPMSNSPPDDLDFIPRSSTFSNHGSGSLSNSMHSTPYGTPGMQMPAHGFYSVSMPVHATNGFGVMDQSKMMGSQPSSYSAYGGPGGPGGAGSGGDLDDPNLKPMDVITEKRRRRRESHNAVERRRRDNINEKIQELATLLPDFLPTDDPAASTTNSTTGGPSTTPTAGTTPTSSSQAAPSSSASLLANRPNKGVILRRSVDYIRQIQHFAMLLVDRHHELDTALRAVLDRTGIPEQELGLSQPLGTSVEMPNLAQVQQMQLQMQQMQLQQQHPGQQMGQHGQGHGHGQSQGQQQQQQQGQPTQQHFDLADLGLADHPLDEYENDM